MLLLLEPTLEKVSQTPIQITMPQCLIDRLLLPDVVEMQLLFVCQLESKQQEQQSLSVQVSCSLQEQDWECLNLLSLEGARPMQPTTRSKEERNFPLDEKEKPP